MAYTFSNTQGDRTITVNDNQLDQTSYSLTLLGKNVTNYGERIAENTIRQLENFASPNQPNPTVKLNPGCTINYTTNNLITFSSQSDSVILYGISSKLFIVLNSSDGISLSAN